MSVSPSGKVLVAVKEAKLRREAKIKYNMTEIKVTTRPIKNSSENVETSTISEFEEFMESVKQYELERQEFVGEPYYTEFKVEEERESTQRQMNWTLNFIRSEAFKRGTQHIANIKADFLRSTQQAANIKADFLRSTQHIANIKADFLRSTQQAANIKADFLRRIRY